MALRLALKVHQEDNVATIFATDVVEGTPVEVRDKSGVTQELAVRGDVPYGHKIAVADIAPGEAVLKYGEAIGAATRPIKKGDYVHVHNLDSMRGRGDLQGG